MNWAGKKNDTTGAKMIPYCLFCEYWRKPVYILQFFVLWSSQITCCWSCYCFKHFCMFDLTKSHNMTEGTHCMQWSGGGLSVFVLKSQLLLKNGDFWLKFQKMDIKRDSNMAPSMTPPPPHPLRRVSKSIAPTFGPWKSHRHDRYCVSGQKQPKDVTCITKKWYHPVVSFFLPMQHCIMLNGFGFAIVLFPIFFYKSDRLWTGLAKIMIPLEQK